MQKISKWVLCACLSASVVAGVAGCSPKAEDDAVPPPIQSPVMNRANDSAAAGTGATNRTPSNSVE